MMLDLDGLIRRHRMGETFTFLYFRGSHTERIGEISSSCLSQWYHAPFIVDDMLYPTAEHWMMASTARLFKDHEVLDQILQTDDPKFVKALGRQIKKFKDDVRKKNARQFVVEGNIGKFSQNAHLKKYLLATGDAVIVEAHPYDQLWGIGLEASDERAKKPTTWLGQNWLGFALMEVRAKLATEA